MTDVPIEKVIEEAVARYERERDRYLKLAARVADICRSEIAEANAIRAQVTARAKSSKSFEGKLRRFTKNPDKRFETVEQAFEKIGDLAGVRIAAYQLETIDRIIDGIQSRFKGPQGEPVQTERKDKIKDKDGSNFYWSIHCQVFLPAEDLVGTYENLRLTSCEVQICSMMTHVWNEIEHDIGWKPEGGSPKETEQGLLMALGHLTRSGDQIITRLLEANAARLEEQVGEFEDVHDFVARLRKDFPVRDFDLHAGQLFDETQALGLTSREKLELEISAESYSLDAARQKIVRFNEYLKEKNQGDLALDEQSSDVILALLLEKFANQIENNHPAGRGMGRPPRIRSIATRYLQYKESPIEGSRV